MRVKPPSRGTPARKAVRSPSKPPKPAKPAKRATAPKAATWSRTPKRRAAAGFITPRKPNPVGLPKPHPDDNGQLALDGPIAKGSKPKRLKLTSERELERPVHRSIGSHLNSNMRDGGAWHPVNEQALIGLLPDDDSKRRYMQAMLSDGMLPGVTDFVAMWAMPRDWRRILEAAGVKLPPLVALCAGLEVKPPGWRPDAEWRSGNQPKAHAQLARWGVPVAIVHSFVEAQDVLEAFGAPMKFQILTARGHLGARTPVKHEATGGKKKEAPKKRGARRLEPDAPLSNPLPNTTTTRRLKETQSSQAKKGSRKHESR